MPSSRALLLALGFMAAVSTARAAETPKIGIAAPLTGAAQVLGRQLVSGAVLAAADTAVEIADDRCTAEGGAEVAQRFVAGAVTVAVGFLCTEAIESALPVLSKAGIAVVTPGVRAEWLTDRRSRTGWLLYRLAPRGDAEAEAVARLLTERWRDTPFAVVDDGTIYGRDLVEALREAARAKGMEPVFSDTYRPQVENQVGLVGRLRRSGAASVFVGGERDDVAVIARDAAALGAPITIAGGEVLRAAAGSVALAPGVLMVGLPEWADIADPGALRSLADRGIVAEGYVLPAYAAMQVALSLAAIPASADADGKPALYTGPFQTVLGTIAFDAKGDLAKSPFGLFRYNGSRFVPAGTP